MRNPEQNSLRNLEHTILPIFVASDIGATDINLLSHEGTGFLIGRNTFVTCWHCVREPLPSGQAYIVTVIGADGPRWYRLLDIEQDPSGTDLAVARVENLEPKERLTIAAEQAPLGTPVWSYGYPHTGVEALPDNLGKRFMLNGRFMRSYVMRVFYHDWAKLDRIWSYELEMPALAGMSGAPIMRWDSTGGPIGSIEVIGVLYGRVDVETIEEFSRKDPDTGKRTPERVRTSYFAAAHHTSTLQNLSGTATEGRPLAEFLGA